MYFRTNVELSDAMVNNFSEFIKSVVKQELWQNKNCGTPELRRIRDHFSKMSNHHWFSFYYLRRRLRKRYIVVLYERQS